jgi:hypothetical protein
MYHALKVTRAIHFPRSSYFYHDVNSTKWIICYNSDRYLHSGHVLPVKMVKTADIGWTDCEAGMIVPIGCRRTSTNFFARRAISFTTCVRPRRCLWNMSSLPTLPAMRASLEYKGLPQWDTVETYKRDSLGNVQTIRKYFLTWFYIYISCNSNDLRCFFQVGWMCR